MLTTQYLYGVSASLWKDEPYHRALHIKFEYASKLFNKLYKIYNDTTEWDSTLDLRARIAAVQNAMKHNRNLMDELIEEESQE